MKKTIFSLLFIFVAVSTLAQTTETFPSLALKIGDSFERMTEVLGEPNGKMEAGDFSIYYYKLGNVHLKSGKVSSMKLITEQQWQENQSAEAEAREARILKGEELLASIKEDEGFAELPAESRYAFWQQFRKDYPEVDVYVLYSQAKIEAEKIAEKKREEDRLAALERRVLLAEIEAKNATQAAQTRALYEQNRYNRYPSVIVYPQSYIIRKPINRPTPYTGNSLTLNGNGLNLTIGSGSTRRTTTTTTGGFVNGQNGVMRIQSSQGFIQDFY